MTDTATSEPISEILDRPIGAAYWQPRQEPSTRSAQRLLDLLTAIDRLYADDQLDRDWDLVVDRSTGSPISHDPADLARQLEEHTRARDVPCLLSGTVHRLGLLSVRFTLGNELPRLPDNVIVSPRRADIGSGIVAALVESFAPAWAVFGVRRLRTAQRPNNVSSLVPWLGAVTYLPGSHQAPEGAAATPLGDGTLIDFTQDGTVEPDDATILAAVDQVLPRTG